MYISGVTPYVVTRPDLHQYSGVCTADSVSHTLVCKADPMGQTQTQPISFPSCEVLSQRSTDWGFVRGLLTSCLWLTKLGVIHIYISIINIATLNNTYTIYFTYDDLITNVYLVC